MHDLVKRLHEGNRSENLDQQIIMGEADLEMHNCTLSKWTKSSWAAEGVTESHPKVLHSSQEGNHVTPQGYLPATKSTSR